MLVAGLRSGTGASADLMRAVTAGAVRPVVSVALAFEYRDVLSRPGTCGLTAAAAERVVTEFVRRAEHVRAWFAWPDALPDPADEHVLLAALAADNCPIVTHNVRDFRPVAEAGLPVLTPAEFLATLRVRHGPPTPPPS